MRLDQGLDDLFLIRVNVQVLESLHVPMYVLYMLHVEQDCRQIV